jgi:hypothetical protein
MRPFRNVFTRWPFTAFGLFSFLLLSLSAYGLIPIDGVWRALIILPYVIHLLIVMLAVQLFGASESARPLLIGFYVLTLPLRFLPFLLVDILLNRARRRRRAQELKLQP